MIYYRASEDSIAVYFDLPANRAKSYSYCLNGEKKGERKQTDFLFEGLLPDTEYLISISPLGESIRVKTLAKKNIIDISLPPFNALGDGKTLNTKAIQAAIDACDSHSKVVVPAGDFLTGCLTLHSDMELYLQEGAILHGTADFSDYLPRIKSRFEGKEMECYSSLLNFGALDHNSINARNLIIRGKGTICSGGHKLAKAIIDDETIKLKGYLDSLGDSIKEFETGITIQGRVRPRLLNISSAENVWISGVTLKDSASWNVHMVYSKNIWTDNVSIISYGVWNGDGWDPDSSSDCVLFASTFDTGDDCVAIKSGKNPEGNKINIPSRNIKVFDVKAKRGHGICIGSEMSGGVSDVRVWDADLSLSWVGFELKTTPKRGGYIRNVSIRDSLLSRLSIHNVSYNDDGESSGIYPTITNIKGEGLTIEGRYLDQHNLEGGGIHTSPYILVEGFADKPSNFSNIHFDGLVLLPNGEDKGIVISNCEDVTYSLS